jgi:hypothetical protein
MQPEHTAGTYLNPLNAELNFICHLLTLLGAHHILHVSRIRVKILLLYSPFIIFEVRLMYFNLRVGTIWIGRKVAGSIPDGLIGMFH